MKQHRLVLPDLGEGISEATISQWLVEEGDPISPGNDVVEIVADKASFMVPAEISGTVEQICARPGRKVRVGEVLALISITA